MAKSEVNTRPPLSVPQSLGPIVAAFSAESEEAAHGLIEQAAKAIYGEFESDEWSILKSRKRLSAEDIYSVYSLMKAINPQDMLETLHGAQIIVSHMLGMKKLAQSHLDDQNLGLKLLRLSNEALERLERKRNGGHQHINVTYHNNAPSMQALLTPSLKE